MMAAWQQLQGWQRGLLYCYRKDSGLHIAWEGAQPLVKQVLGCMSQNPVV